MTVIAHGFVIHSYLNKQHGCKTEPAEAGVRTFKIRCNGLVSTGDYILRYSDDGSCKTVWRIISVSRVDQFHHTGRMEDIMFKREALPQRLMSAMKLAENNR